MIQWLNNLKYGNDSSIPHSKLAQTWHVNPRQWNNNFLLLFWLTHRFCYIFFSVCVCFCLFLFYIHLHIVCSFFLCARVAIVIEECSLPFPSSSLLFQELFVYIRLFWGRSVYLNRWSSGQCIFCLCYPHYIKLFVLQLYEYSCAFIVRTNNCLANVL